MLAIATAQPKHLSPHSNEIPANAAPVGATGVALPLARNSVTPEAEKAADNTKTRNDEAIKNQ